MRVIIEPHGSDEIAGAVKAVGALFVLLVAITIVFFAVRVGAEVVSPSADPTTTEPAAPPAPLTAYSPPPPPVPTPRPTCYPFQPC